MTSAELRVALAKLELRSGGTTTKTVQGYASLYEPVQYTVKDHYGAYTERIARGAFTNAIRSSDIRFQVDHAGPALARTKSGTLRVESDSKGLRFEADLDVRDSVSHDLIVRVGRGDISQCSFGFVCGADEWNTDQTERRITTVDKIMDLSAVTFPASEATSIELAERFASSAGVEIRAGRVLSEKNANRILQAHAHLGAVLEDAGLDGTTTGDGLDGPEVIPDNSREPSPRSVITGDWALRSRRWQPEPVGDRVLSARQRSELAWQLWHLTRYYPDEVRQIARLRQILG